MGQPQYGMPQPPQGYGQAPGYPQQGQQAGYPQQGMPPGYPQQQMMPQQPAKPGFIKSLLDFSFSTFVTTGVVKLIDILALVFGALGAVGSIILGVVAIVSGATSNYGGAAQIGTGVGMIIGAPIGLFFYVILMRVYMELIIVIFRIAENIGEINRKTKA